MISSVLQLSYIMYSFKTRNPFSTIVGVIKGSSLTMNGIIQSCRYLGKHYQSWSYYDNQFVCVLPELYAKGVPIGTPPGPPTFPKGCSKAVRRRVKRARKSYRKHCLLVLLKEVVEAAIVQTAFTVAIKQEMYEEFLLKAKDFVKGI
jgi:hypothetical protein